jgi:hypothetical protein
VALLDSPHPAERQAAQEGLAEFTLDRFAANYDDLTPTARASAGALVRRADATALPRLARELAAEARGVRKKALELAVALGAVGQLEEPIAALLQDEDPYLRMEAIRTLAASQSASMQGYMRDALLDPHPLVQQAAEAALRELKCKNDTVSLTADGSRDTLPMHATLAAGSIDIAAEAIS